MFLGEFMTKYEKGKIVKGTVTGITNYGIFVSFDEYYSGLIHISEISNDFVKNINDYAKIGDIISTRILDAEPNSCHLKLSIKDIGYAKKKVIHKHVINETPSGFLTLKANLPIWIEKNLKNQKNVL